MKKQTEENYPELKRKVYNVRHFMFGLLINSLTYSLFFTIHPSNSFAQILNHENTRGTNLIISNASSRLNESNYLIKDSLHVKSISNCGPIAAPILTVIQPTNAVVTGTISVTSPIETGMTYSFDGITYNNTSGVFTTLSPGVYTISAKNSSGCISLVTVIKIRPFIQLGIASDFSIYSTNGAISITDPSTIVTGDIGSMAGAINVPQQILQSQIHKTDAIASLAATNVTAAYTELTITPCNTTLPITLGNGQILKSGTYCIGAAATLAGDLILDGEGDSNTLFIIKIDGAFDTGVASNIILRNSASINNVYWLITGATTLGANSNFQGSLLTTGAINFTAGASLIGRALSTAGAISLYGNISVTGTLSTYNLADDWLGITSSWNTASNWSGGVPTATTDVVIHGGATLAPSLDIPMAQCRNLTIQTGGIFTINGGYALTVSGNLVNIGTLTINSEIANSGSLIVNGTSTGNVTYNRFMIGSRWHITSAPVSTITGFKTNNSPNLTDTHFANYDELNNVWNYTAVPSTLTPGKGYLNGLNNSTTMNFAGELNEAVSITVTRSTLKGGWNALGNPYTSAIGITSSAGTAQNFLTLNASKLSTNYAAIYVWNESAAYDGNQQYYKVISNSGYADPLGFETLSSDFAQVGQGFLVNVLDAVGSTTIDFTNGTTGMQGHATTETLKSAAVSWPGITLLVTNGTQTRNTVVAFNENMTSGVDKTYDAGLLSSDNFQIYTRLTSGQSDVNFAIQCFPEIYAQLSVPVGVDILIGGEVTFKAAGIILPVGYYPVLEDKALKIFTPLKTDSDNYKVILAANSTGTGRFYLHFSGGNITTETPAEQSFMKYSIQSANGEIIITGQVEPGTKAKIFDVLGRKLGEYLLMDPNQNKFAIPGTNHQVYLVEITHENYRQVMKIINMN